VRAPRLQPSANESVLASVAFTGDNLRMVKVLYFARLREALGTSSEELSLPESVRDLASLRETLVGRGGAWAQELAPAKPLRAAVNQEIATPDTPISDNDEIAFFPPVTGG
jgi:sulfur-carrier protein